MKNIHVLFQCFIWHVSLMLLLESKLFNLFWKLDKLILKKDRKIRNSVIFTSILGRLICTVSKTGPPVIGFKSSVTFFLFSFFFFFLMKKVQNSGLLSRNCFTIRNQLGFHKKNTSSSLKFSIKWTFTICNAFLPSIEKVSQKTQLHSFKKSNLEKKTM